MSLVIFDLSGRSVTASAGDRLLDVLDEIEHHGLPIACRSANCGACRVRVLEGAQALDPPTAAELRLLTQCNAVRNERLGCQICVRAHPQSAHVKLERA